MLALYVQAHQLAHQFKRDRKAVTAMEYGLIAALVSTVLITVFVTLGPALSGAFGKITSALIAN